MAKTVNWEGVAKELAQRSATLPLDQGEGLKAAKAVLFGLATAIQNNLNETNRPGPKPKVLDNVEAV